MIWKAQENEHTHTHIYDSKYEKIASINTDSSNVRLLASG